MSVKILASSDLHLGKQTSGISAFGDNCSTKLTWNRMVDYAIDNAVDAMVLAGDVIDRNNRYYEASGALQNGFGRLKDNNIDVFMVSGNHDYDVLAQMTRNHPFSNVHLLGADGHWEVFCYERKEEMIQFVGWSFPHQYVMNSPASRLPEIKIDPNFLRIGVMHADVNNLESKYAPVSLGELQTSGVDIWMLGHIHKPSDFGGSKIIRYPGSPQSLSAKEPGAHGALLLTIENIHSINVEEVNFSNCRFEPLTVDTSAVDTEETLRGLIETELSADANAMLSELSGILYLVYDLHLTGQNSKGRELLSWAGPIIEGYELLLATETRLLVRGVSSSIRPVVDNLEVLAAERSPAGLLAQTILALRNGTSTPFLDELVQEWEVQFRNITNSSIYQPLQEEWQRNPNLRKAKDFIEQECNRLLNELLFPAN